MSLSGSSPAFLDLRHGRRAKESPSRSLDKVPSDAPLSSYASRTKRPSEISISSSSDLGTASHSRSGSSSPSSSQTSSSSSRSDTSLKSLNAYFTLPARKDSDELSVDDFLPAEDRRTYKQSQEHIDELENGLKLTNPHVHASKEARELSAYFLQEREYQRRQQVSAIPSLPEAEANAGLLKSLTEKRKQASSTVQKPAVPPTQSQTKKLTERSPLGSAAAIMLKQASSVQYKAASQSQRQQVSGFDARSKKPIELAHSSVATPRVTV